MTKLQFNGNQFTITISKELIERVSWKKGANLFVGKGRNEDFLYIEEAGKKKMIEIKKELQSKSTVGRDHGD